MCHARGVFHHFSSSFFLIAHDTRDDRSLVLHRWDRVPVLILTNVFHHRGEDRPPPQKSDRKADRQHDQCDRESVVEASPPLARPETTATAKPVSPKIAAIDFASSILARSSNESGMTSPGLPTPTHRTGTSGGFVHSTVIAQVETQAASQLLEKSRFRDRSLASGRHYRPKRRARTPRGLCIQITRMGAQAACTGQRRYDRSPWRQNT